MDILRYYEAKQQNRKTVGFIRDLVSDGRIKDLPGALGLHYRRFDPDSDDYSPAYCVLYNEDRYIVNLLTCCNELNGIVTNFGDVRITGSHHCNNIHLCAECGTREARRVSSQLAYQFFCNKDKHYDYYMLTLTLPNSFDGFREEFEVLNGCLRSVFNYCGFRDNGKSDSPCKGVFAARELTYSKDHGWHPHIHIILAYENNVVSSVKEDRFGNIKCMRVNSRRPFDLSSFSIADFLLDKIEELFPFYYHDHILKYITSSALDGKKFRLSTKFERIIDIDNAVDEICKYFIDFNCFKDADTLFVYLRDIYRLQKYTKKGCFSWNKDKERLWRKWCELGKPLSDEISILSNWHNSSDYTYLGVRYAIDSIGLVPFPAVIPNHLLINDGQEIVIRWDKSCDRYYYTYFDTDFNENKIYFDKCLSCMSFIGLPFYQWLYEEYKKLDIYDDTCRLDIDKLKWKEEIVDACNSPGI